MILFTAPTPPRITTPHDAKTIVVQEGSTKVLKCVARGAPKPNVTWYKNGKQLHTNDRSCKAIQAYKVYDENEDNSLYTVQVLRIRSVLYPRDQGEFKCVASNDVTDVQTVFNVQVQGEFQLGFFKLNIRDFSRRKTKLQLKYSKNPWLRSWFLRTRQAKIYQLSRSIQEPV